MVSLSWTLHSCLQGPLVCAIPAPHHCPLIWNVQPGYLGEVSSKNRVGRGEALGGSCLSWIPITVKLQWTLRLHSYSWDAFSREVTPSLQYGWGRRQFHTRLIGEVLLLLVWLDSKWGQKHTLSTAGSPAFSLAPAASCASSSPLSRTCSSFPLYHLQSGKGQSWEWNGKALSPRNSSELQERLG